MRSDDLHAVGAVMALKVIAISGTPLFGATMVALGFVSYEFVSSPDFIKFLCVVITGAVAIGNAVNNQQIQELRKIQAAKDERLQAQEQEIAEFRTMADRNRAMVEEQQRQLVHMQAEQVKRDVELAQVSAEQLRDKGVFQHSGRRTPLRPTVPPDAADVLIVDDDASTGERLARLLSLYGLRAEACRTIDQAATLIHRRATAGRRFTHVLLDMVFPEGSGLQILDLLRSGPVGRGTVAVVVSGSSDVDLHGACRKAGAKAVLVKPIDPDELLALLGCNPDRPPPGESGMMPVVRPDGAGRG